MTAASSNPVPPTPIAVIGMSCLFPNAPGLKEYWRLIRRSEDAIREVPDSHWQLDDYFDADPKSPDMTYCRRGAFLEPVSFDPVEFGIPPAILEATDTAQLLGLLVAKRALQDAGYGAGREFDRTRASVILGVTGTLELVIPLGARLGHPQWRRAMLEHGIDPVVAESVAKQISDGYVGWQENSFPGLLGNVVAGRIANRLNLKGTNCVVDAACASSLSALHLATMELAAGRSDLVLTGGVDTLNDIFMFMCFSKTQALSASGDARPFSKHSDGTVIGEGIGMLALKRLADAERDGDRIYAVIKGVGTSSDGRSQSIYAPRAEGQAIALRDAYSISGVSPATVELVEAHGTGTKVGDVVEFEALNTVYREAAADGKWCAVGSVKSQIGHTKAAAGVASMIKGILALHEWVLPATIKSDEPNPKLGVDESPFYIATEPRPWFATDEHPRRAGVSSFGFGGSNFHAVLEEYPTAEREPAWDGSVEIVAISADSRDGLNDKLGEWANFASGIWKRDDFARRAHQSRSEFRASDAYRLALVHEYDDDLANLITSAQRGIAAKGVSGSWAVGNIFFGGNQEPGELAFLFPGQGSQYIGMGREVVCLFPEAHDAVADFNLRGLAADSPDRPLSDFIYPMGASTEEGRKVREAELTQTNVAQPAIGAVSAALLRVLGRFGIQPRYVGGHSYGELVALHAAGIIDEAGLRELSRIRGELMAEASGEDGAMLAVHAPLEEIQRIIAEQKFDVVLANHNSPTQGILSGSKAAIEAVEKFIESKLGWRTKLLQVSAAFHSRLMAEAEKRFRAALDLVPFHDAMLTVFSNVTGRPHPLSPGEMRDLLARQLTHPVMFLDEIRSMYDTGVRTFVEVGPKNVLTGLVNNILDGLPHVSIATDSSGGRRRMGVVDIAKVVAVVAVIGHMVDLTAWESDPPAELKQNMSVALIGANYRVKPKVASQSRPGELVLESESADVVARQNPAGDLMDDAVPIAGAATERPIAKRDNATLLPISSEGSVLMNEHAQFAARAAPGVNGGPPPTAQNGTLSPAAQSNGNGYAHAQPAPSGDALTLVAEALRNMQYLQQQTAAAHQRFLEGQERAHYTFQVLMERALGAPASASSLASPALARAPQLAPPVSPVPTSVPAAMPAPTSFISAHRGMPPETVAITNAYVPSPVTLETQPPVPIGPSSYQPSAYQPATPASADFPPSTTKFTNGHSSHSNDAPRADRVETAVSRTGQEMAADETQSGVNFESVLLQVVAELTGYPVEMLNLDMDMEADLGIDSIKRLEILSNVQRRLPHLEQVNSQYLGSLRTLRNIIEYMSKGDAGATTASATKTDEPAEPRRHKIEPSGNGQPLPKALTPAGHATARPASQSSSQVAHSRMIDGYNRRVLRAVQSAPVSFGRIALASDHVVWVTDDGAGVARALVDELSAIGVPAIVVTLESAASMERPIPVAGLVIVSPPGSATNFSQHTERFIKRAFALVRHLAADLRTAATRGGALLATVSRLDGAFGLATDDWDAMQGGLAGLVKTAADEWDGVRCRAIDVARSWTDTRAIARGIANELSQEAAREVGLAADGRRTLELSSVSATVSASRLNERDVVLVTGGARGVTAATALALARHIRPTLILLGRSPMPQPEPPWLAGIDGEAAMKKAILANAFSGTKPTPAQLEREYRQRQASREVLRTLDAMRIVGAMAEYRSIDVRDSAAVDVFVRGVREAFGPIRGIVHGAGVIEDARIEDKTDDAFDRVFDTKIHGLANLLAATAGDELQLIALFSSVSGRFGRRGQVDYAMANEVLNKVAQRIQRARPAARIVSINWGPWAGGMVTPALKREFERMGVGLIPLEVGADAFVAEVLHGGDASSGLDGAVEVVIDCGDGFKPAATAARDDTRRVATQRPIFTRRVDAKSHSFLRSHEILGKPVLPVAMAAEWMMHAAASASPGLCPIGFEDLRVLKGVVLDCPAQVLIYADEPHPHIATGSATQQLAVEMRTAGKSGETRHFAARVLLAKEHDTAIERVISLNGDSKPYSRTPRDVYDEILFHGPTFHAFEQFGLISREGLEATVRVSGNPADWMLAPARGEWHTHPLVLDAALQLGLVWCHEFCGSISLPTHIARYRQFASLAGPLLSLALRTRESGQTRLLADIAVARPDGAIVATLTGVEWIVNASLAKSAGRAPIAGSVA